MSSINVTAESAASSVLEGVSESAILRPGDFLSIRSRKLVSTNGNFSLKFNGNGGGYISVWSPHGIVWTSHLELWGLLGCCTMPDDVLIMEENGNLIFYTETFNQRITSWQSNTTGEGNFLVLKDDGKLVIFDKNNQQIWSSIIVTGESAPFLPLEGVSESAILRQENDLSHEDSRQLVSTNGKYSIKFNENGGGYFSVVSSDGIAWISNPKYLEPGLGFFCHKPDNYLLMCGSGNLIFYSQIFKPRAWQSNTTGRGNFLVLKDDGTLGIFNINNQQIWSTDTDHTSTIHEPESYSDNCVKNDH